MTERKLLSRSLVPKGGDPVWAATSNNVVSFDVPHRSAVSDAVVFANVNRFDWGLTDG